MVTAKKVTETKKIEIPEPILATPPVTLPPTTTMQEDMITAGQRRINLIWEFTQSLVAVIITSAVVYCAINKIENDVLTNAFFLIVSMYFVRTNHQLIGGVGGNYKGR
jgi:hypothetical protein